MSNIIPPKIFAENIIPDHLAFGVYWLPQTCSSSLDAERDLLPGTASRAAPFPAHTLAQHRSSKTCLWQCLAPSLQKQQVPTEMLQGSFTQGLTPFFWMEAVRLMWAWEPNMDMEACHQELHLETLVQPLSGHWIADFCFCFQNEYSCLCET